MLISRGHTSRCLMWFKLCDDQRTQRTKAAVGNEGKEGRKSDEYIDESHYHFLSILKVEYKSMFLSSHHNCFAWGVYLFLVGFNLTYFDNLNHFITINTMFFLKHSGVVTLIVNIHLAVFVFCNSTLIIFTCFHIKALWHKKSFHCYLTA